MAITEQRQAVPVTASLYVRQTIRSDRRGDQEAKILAGSQKFNRIHTPTLPAGRALSCPPLYNLTSRG
jgi:hypothetical protein